MVSICRTLYDAKIVSIGYTTSMVAVEIRVPSRGMRQMDVHMGRGMMGKWINIDDLPSGRVEWDDVFDAPSIDIVRCKECKYRNRCSTMIVFGDPERITDAFSIDFCSYGEREGE